MSVQEQVALRVSRRFAASPQQVFDAWTNPEVLRRWWAAGPQFETTFVEVDPRPGGRYRLTMRDGESGEEHTVAGEYTEVTPPERLAYTWTWESNPDAMAGSAGTVVVVQFRPEGDGTEVVVEHSGFATPEIRDLHVQGWEGCLDSLERALN
jgi:uncharacterized protein YndB with AHSA1/START domain